MTGAHRRPWWPLRPRHPALEHALERYEEAFRRWAASPTRENERIRIRALFAVAEANASDPGARS